MFFVTLQIEISNGSLFFYLHFTVCTKVSPEDGRVRLISSSWTETLDWGGEMAYTAVIGASPSSVGERECRMRKWV